MWLFRVSLVAVFCARIEGYYSVEGGGGQRLRIFYPKFKKSSINPNPPPLPWTPITSPGGPQGSLLPGPPDSRMPMPPFPYYRPQPWGYGYPDPNNGLYGPVNGGGSYGGYSNWPYQPQNWLPWRPLIPKPKPQEEKESSTGSVVEVPIKEAVEGQPGELPFPKNH
ncbi:hypothetical protein L596_025402 [Steinernema carpocapsae]|uniref:Uncharacterized protein n=1 Tax=Steinernema carpocapsae TaxID=34508 RepID=A0A4U5M7P0_STECR|nr:hypothetical protein L596_025402 [Steinernema carpocapsae]